MKLYQKIKKESHKKILKKRVEIKDEVRNERISTFKHFFISGNNCFHCSNKENLIKCRLFEDDPMKLNRRYDIVKEMPLNYICATCFSRIRNAYFECHRKLLNMCTRFEKTNKEQKYYPFSDYYNTEKYTIVFITKELTEPQKEQIKEFKYIKNKYYYAKQKGYEIDFYKPPSLRSFQKYRGFTDNLDKYGNPRKEAIK